MSLLQAFITNGTVVRKKVIEQAAIRAQCGDPKIEDNAGKLLLAIDKFNHAVLESEQKRIKAEHDRFFFVVLFFFVKLVY